MSRKVSRAYNEVRIRGRLDNLRDTGKITNWHFNKILQEVTIWPTMTYWKSGMPELNRVALADAVRELNRAYHRDIANERIRIPHLMEGTPRWKISIINPGYKAPSTVRCEMVSHFREQRGLPY